MYQKRHLAVLIQNYKPKRLVSIFQTLGVSSIVLNLQNQKFESIFLATVLFIFDNFDQISQVISVSTSKIDSFHKNIHVDEVYTNSQFSVYIYFIEA